MSQTPVVAIVMGSRTDFDLMRPAKVVLEQLGVPAQVRVISAHRTPERALELAQGAKVAGLKVLICGAGGAAHLAGVIAAHTMLPVIGVPLGRSLGGLDSLYATVQMPPGVPVATVGIDAAHNAGLLAAQILAQSDAKLADRLLAHRDRMRAEVEAADRDVRERS